jgi:predicted molibdopterin-dependent oxidoreductase YjgC
VTRIEEHPILGPLQPTQEITITVDGVEMEAREGEVIAAALLANGKRVFRYTNRRGEPRDLFCGIGRCTDCVMIVDGVPNTRTCITRVRDGMKIETQRGLGVWGDSDDRN